MAFWYRKGDDTNYTLASNETSMTGSYFVYDGLSEGDGEYDLKINTTSNSESDTLTSIYRDTVNPNDPSSESPTGDISDTDPEVSMDVSDDLSGIDYSFLNVSDSDDDSVDSTVGTSLDLDDLNDGEHTVDYTVVDNAGNERTGDWTFTVDTSFDGDSSPSIEWDTSPNDGIILMDEDETVTIGYDDDDEEPDEVTCYDDGDAVDSDSSADDNDNEYQFECDFDEDDYGGSEIDFTVEACDNAGNCDEYDAEDIVFDTDAPSFVENPSTAVSTFNSDFEVNFAATDESGLDELEYYFDSDTDQGDGNTIDIDDSTEEFTVNVSDLNNGQHTLYVRLKDNAERWSDPESFDFEYDSNANPEITLNMPSSLTVTAGQSRSFDVNIENTGNLLVSGAELTAQGPGLDSTKSVTELFPDEDTNLSFQINPGEADIGEQQVTVSSESPQTSQTMSLRVKADQDQRSEIESNLSEYQSMLQTLDSNVSSLKQKGLSSTLSSQLDSNFSSFKQKVDDAQAAVDNGEYYKAESMLAELDSAYQKASNSYSDVKQTYESNQKTNMIIMAFGGLFGLAILAGGFLWRSEEYDFDIEEIIDSDLDVDGLEGLKSRISTIFENKEEAEEFEWNGFK